MFESVFERGSAKFSKLGERRGKDFTNIGTLKGTVEVLDSSLLPLDEFGGLNLLQHIQSMLGNLEPKT